MSNQINSQTNSNHSLLHPMRHSAEHVLTMAMLKLYPDLKMAMGPATDTGFYFDFELDTKISQQDFKTIEKEMHHIINQALPIEKEEIPVKKARELFKNNPYKQDWLDKIEEKQQPATIYWIGKGSPEEFVDLCSGPHLENTKDIGAFKLLSVAGAYWHGDENKQMLTRIYGTAFPSKPELNDYLVKLEQAKKRDHRKLGADLELFMFDDEVGQGLPLYLPKGAMVRHLLMDFALNTYFKHGYLPVSTPHIGNEKLWQHSGHLDFYSDSMYGPVEIEDKKYRLKPMNCPFHVKMYTSKQRSYKELPIRWTEMGTVYRFEKSGELHGLTRPRAFTQDDAHIICTPDQLESEISAAIDLINYIYNTLGMKNLIYKLSTRNPEKKDKYFGSNQQWDQAESSLRKVLNQRGINDFEIDEGGAAFYAPKIDIDAVDSMDRRWQLSTLQVDFNLPIRFNMNYIDQDGQEKQPFMIHRALLGSIERFLGVYIEHTAGAFPLWLSPIQVSIIPISDQFSDYSKHIYQSLKEQGIRVELNDQAESMQKRIRTAESQKIPYMLIIGQKEQQEKTVSLRARGRKDLGSMEIEEFLTKLKKEIENKDL